MSQACVRTENNSNNSANDLAWKRLSMDNDEECNQEVVTPVGNKAITFPSGARALPHLGQFRIRRTTNSTSERDRHVKYN